MKRIAIALPGLLLLTACKVGPNYSRPQAQAPEGFREAPKTEDPKSFADTPWWELFDDPALQTLVDEALKNAPSLQIATSRVEEARSRAMIAKADYWPQVNYGVGAARSKDFDPFGNLMTGNRFQAQISVSWEIDLWGKTRRSSEASFAEFLSTVSARRAVLLSLVSEVAANYFELRGLDLQLEVAQRTAKTQQDTLDLFTRRLAGGVSNKLETSRAEANLGQALAAIPNLQRQITLKENQLCLLVGRLPGPIKRGKGLLEQSQAPQVPIGLPSSLLERRPDVMAAEQQLMAANARVGVATANMIPTLTISGFFGLSSADQSKLTDTSASGVWGIGAGLFGPIFQGKRLSSIKQATVAASKTARVQYQQAVMEGFREVSDALVSRTRYEEVVRAQQRTVDALTLAVKLANERYQGGLSSYLEVLDAEQLLFSAELLLAQSRTSYAISYVTIYKALGGGWKLGDHWQKGSGSGAPPADGKPKEATAPAAKS